MSDTTDPGQTPDATPTEALQLADQQPVAAAPAPAPVAANPPAGRSHTRTILEVVGGVVAVGLILMAGVVGFAVGHATGSDRNDRWDGSGQRMMQGFGQQGQGQQGQRGIDPDGDNWTGGQQGQGMMPGFGQQGQGMMPGFGQQGQGMMPGFGQQGQGMMPGFGQGVDPDGDNWTGGQQQDPTQPSPQAS